jgi:hypothetical protein
MHPSLSNIHTLTYTLTDSLNPDAPFSIKHQHSRIYTHIFTHSIHPHVNPLMFSLIYSTIHSTTPKHPFTLNHVFTKLPIHFFTRSIFHLITLPLIHLLSNSLVRQLRRPLIYSLISQTIWLWSHTHTHDTHVWLFCQSENTETRHASDLPALFHSQRHVRILRLKSVSEPHTLFLLS